MKKCKTCGQKVPLKAGEFVEFSVSGQARWYTQRGIVTRTNGDSALILGLVDCLSHNRPLSALTRLHGYFRITEREPLG